MMREARSGLIVNRRLGVIEIADLLMDLGKPSEGAEGKIDLFLGGPVEPERGFILHSADSIPEYSNPVGDDFAVTGMPDILTSIAEGERSARQPVRAGLCRLGARTTGIRTTAQGLVRRPADPEFVFHRRASEDLAAGHGPARHRPLTAPGCRRL